MVRGEVAQEASSRVSARTALDRHRGVTASGTMIPMGEGRVGAVCAAVLLFAACSDDAKEGSPCVDDDVECGGECADDAPCAAGLYCSDEGKCSKQCSHLPGFTCQDMAACTVDGRCVGSGTPADDGGMRSAVPGSSGTGGTCADTVVRASQVTPTATITSSAI